MSDPVYVYLLCRLTECARSGNKAQHERLRQAIEVYEDCWPTERNHHRRRLPRVADMSASEPKLQDKCPRCRGRGYLEHVFQEWVDDETPTLSRLRKPCPECQSVVTTTSGELVAAVTSVLLDYFGDGRSSGLKLHRSEALWLASAVLERVDPRAALSTE